jgi:hypothetical protein
MSHYYKQIQNGKDDKRVKYSKCNAIIYNGGYGGYGGPTKKEITDIVTARRETSHDNIMCPAIYRCFKKSERYSLIELNSNDISIVPSKYITLKKCAHAFNHNHSNIKYIPKNCMTLEMCQTAFDMDVDYIRYFPKKYITQEMCQTAFDMDVDYFIIIPKKYITQDMCDSVIQFYPHYILKEIPIKFITDDMCSHIVEDQHATHGYRYICDN